MANKAFLIQVICHGAEKLTGEKICGDMMQLSGWLRQQLNVRVKGLITDNENKMKCRKLFQEKMTEQGCRRPHPQNKNIKTNILESFH